MTMALVFTSEEGFAILSSDVAKNPTDVPRQQTDRIGNFLYLNNCPLNDLEPPTSHQNRKNQ
jgi:hypothetical protein